MTTDRIVRSAAGLMILLSLILAHVTDQADLLKPSWLWLAAFVGLNLFQSGITRFCPMDSILVRLGVRRAQ